MSVPWLKRLSGRAEVKYFPPTNAPVMFLLPNRAGVPIYGQPQPTITFMPPATAVQPLPPPPPSPRPPVQPISVTYWNTEQTCVNTCPVGTTGEPISVTIPANTYSSEVSQEAANEAAMEAACNEAAALREDNPCVAADGAALWGWGLNVNSSLGIGQSGGEQDAPVRIIDGEWLDVASGGRFTIARKTDGTLWGWGRNSQGQMAFGDPLGSNPDVTGPTPLGATGTEWAKISTGAEFAMAIKSDGTLWGWGNSSDGQLGNGFFNDSKFEPTQVGFDTDWSEVSCGYSNGRATLALKTDGTIWACGWNAFGQLGRGTTDTFPEVIYAEMAQIGTDSDWASISMGYNAVMAIKTDGTLWGWGYAHDGAYGYPVVSANPVDQPLVPVQVDLATDWAFCASGRDCGYAIKTDGTLWSSGLNANGELGNGTTDPSTTFQQVGTDTDWHFVYPGGQFTVASKTDGTIWGWGRNDAGQLGQGAPSGPVLSPVQMGSDDLWALLSAGEFNTIALRTSSTSPAPPSGVGSGAFGGAYRESGGNSYHTFGGSSDFVVFEPLVVDILVVGGGGGGGGVGGGGGGQVVRQNSVALTPGTYPVIVGDFGLARQLAGVNRGTNGGLSSFNGTTAAGGGGGGGYESNTITNATGRDGASGGGGGMSISANGPGGAASGGFAGGGGLISVSEQGLGGGGGGGAGAIGQDASGSVEADGTGGNGGSGVSDDITGTAVIYGAGGGGGGWTNAGSGGSSGIGGDGATFTSTPGNIDRMGRDRTGSGGGGGFGDAQISGDGSSGIVIIRYPTP